MSTRSLIALKDSSGVIRVIYCHYDGYIKGGAGNYIQEV